MTNSGQHTDFRIENDAFRLIVSSKGAEMQSLFDRRGGTELLWQGDPRYWAGRSPVLFPIVGRVRGGAYLHKGKTYSIDIPHGFAKDAWFELEYRETNRLQFLLRSGGETRKQYPFDFRLRVEFVLDGTIFRTKFQVENAGPEVMPYSLGAHPGFRIPLEVGERFEDYRLEFASEENPERVLLDGAFISGKKTPFPLTDGKKLPLTHSLFDNEAIILDGIRTKAVSLAGPGDRKRWTLRFDDFDYLGLWQPTKTDAPFVCLEPWNGLPDPSDIEIGELERKPAIRMLKSREHAEMTLQFELS